MIRYEVRLTIDPARAGAVEQYMTSRHIPEILATGCFVRAQFDRSEEGGFRTTYVARGMADFDRYLTNFSTHFRAAFLQEFPTGVSIVRELWTEVEHWPWRQPDGGNPG